MINYTEKGYGLHEAVRDAGYTLARKDDVWVSSDDVAVQAIIDLYDPLPGAKTEKITELKAEGLNRCNLVYDAEDKVFESVAAIKLLIDIDDTYTRSGAPAARLVTVNQILTAFENAKTAINALTTVAEIQAYDVVNTPAWP